MQYDTSLIEKSRENNKRDHGQIHDPRRYNCCFWWTFLGLVFFSGITIFLYYGKKSVNRKKRPLEWIKNIAFRERKVMNSNSTNKLILNK